MNESTKTSARPRGRPRRLTPEAVLEATLLLLEQAPVESLTLSRLAKHLGVTTMSLYTYFPSRDALLDAAAEHVFARFEWPTAEERWQDQVMAWLYALDKHFQNYPIAWKVVKWDEHISPAWVRIYSPIIKLLYDQGLRGKTLALTFAWFIEATVGFITANTNTHSSRLTMPSMDLRALDTNDASALFEYLSNSPHIDREAARDLGFTRLVEGLTTCILEIKGAEKTRTHR